MRVYFQTFLSRLFGQASYYWMLSEETGLSSQLQGALLAAVDSTSHGLPLLVVNCDSVHLSY